jgi:hypothetical protein
MTLWLNPLGRSPRFILDINENLGHLFFAKYYNIVKPLGRSPRFILDVGFVGGNFLRRETLERSPRFILDINENLGHLFFAKYYNIVKPLGRSPRFILDVGFVGGNFSRRETLERSPRFILDINENLGHLFFAKYDSIVKPTIRPPIMGLMA